MKYEVGDLVLYKSNNQVIHKGYKGIGEELCMLILDNTKGQYTTLNLRSSERNYFIQEWFDPNSEKIG